MILSFSVFFSDIQRKRYLILIFELISFTFWVGILGCSNNSSRINKSDKYLFYFHGGVVTVLGDNAINQSMPEWGPYEYSKILDSLRKRNFIVISEIRREGVNDSVYANKTIQQLDSLSKLGVNSSDIVLVGASARWNIVLLVADKLKNSNMNYVIMGGCLPDTYKSYEHYQLKSKFLSIIESSDPHGTCSSVFEGRDGISSFKEIKLNTGFSHGFIYKGHKAWIDPFVAWCESD